MLSKLNFDEKIYLLESLYRKKSNIESSLIREITEFLPFPLKINNKNKTYKNPNFFAIKILKDSKNLVDINLLSKSLKIPTETAKEIIEKKEREVYFPAISKGDKIMVKALIIPLETGNSFSTDPISKDILLTIEHLTNQKFFVTFDHIIDFHKTSFMLALYAGIKLREFWKDNLTFTGVLDREGNIEKVDFLEEKISLSREKGFSIIFPDECMKHVNDLENFLKDPKIPVLALPGETNIEQLGKHFKPHPSYIEKAFHIENGTIYSDNLEKSYSSFNRMIEWIKNISKRIKFINENVIPIRVQFASKVVSFSFIAGIEFSKSRLPTEILNYENETGTYRKICYIDSDKISEINSNISEYITITKGDDIKEIRIHTKRLDLSKCTNESLCIKLPEGKLLEEHAKEIAYLVSKEIYKLKGDKYLKIFIETSNPVSFALGYFTEDYIPLTIYYSDIPVYSTYDKIENPVYLLNAFSLNMLSDIKAFCEIEEISLEKAKSIIERRGFISYISHESTANILSTLFGRKVEFRRKDLKLPQYATAIVFQITRRPEEGKIFDESELKKFIKEGYFKFFLLRVYY